MAKKQPLLFNELIECGPRTYRIEVKISKAGSPYLVILDDDKSRAAGFENSVLVFEQYTYQFADVVARAAGAAHAKIPIEHVLERKPAYRKKPAPPNQGKKWTPEEDADLERRFEEGESITSIAKHFGRKFGAIRSRLKQKNLKRFH